MHPARGAHRLARRARCTQGICRPPAASLAARAACHAAAAWTAGLPRDGTHRCGDRRWLAARAGSRHRARVRMPRGSGGTQSRRHLPGGPPMKTFAQLLRIAFWMLPVQRALTVVGALVVLAALLNNGLNNRFNLPGSTLPMLFLGAALAMIIPLLLGGAWLRMLCAPR